MSHKIKLLFFILLITLSKSSELFEEYYEEADKFLSNMTIEEKIGQIFWPRFMNDSKEKDISETHLGGYVLFAKDFNESKEIIIKNIKYIQELSLNYTKLPLALAVDEEGGTVNRISLFHRDSVFPSPQDIYNESGIDGILKIDNEKRNLLREFGININLAPVADISYNSSDYIYKRTLGKQPNETAEYIKKDVEGYVNDNFSCCNKHFPGYGNNLDTHGTIAKDERPYQTFLDEDFKTFEAGINAKVPMILVSHNIVLCKDEKYPASISKTWHDILRNELKFSGLILTDDMSMDAIKKYSGDLSPAIVAVNAGNDVILTGDYNEHLEAVINATKNGTISNDTIIKAARRVIAWKIKYLGAKYKEDEKGKDDEKKDDGKKEEDNKDDKKNNTTLTICLAVLVVVLLGIIVFFVVKKFFCKNDGVDKDSIENINTNPLTE